MKTIPVYVSTGALITRMNGRNFRLIPEILPLLHADGAEFMMYDSWNDEVDTVRAFLKGTGMFFPVMHADKRIGEMMAELGAEGLPLAQKMLERDIRTADAIGAEKMVLHLWSGPYSDLHFGVMLDGFESLANMAQDSGHALLVENVTCRIARTLPRLRAVHERYPNTKFTYDTKMSHLHAENEMLSKPEWNWLFAEKCVSHLHVNDTTLAGAASGRMPVLHFGDGEIDFASFFDYLRHTGYDGTATVESTSCREDGTIDVEKLNHSLDCVREGLRMD